MFRILEGKVVTMGSCRYLLLIGLFLIGCSTAEQVSPPTRILEKVELPGLAVDNTGDQMAITWKSDLKLPADRNLELVLPVKFVGAPRILTFALQFKNRNGVIVQSSGASFEPKDPEAMDATIQFEFGKVPKGEYEYELSFMTPAGTVNTTGRATVN